MRRQRLGLHVAVALAVVGAALGMADDHGRGAGILRASRPRCRRCGRRWRPAWQSWAPTSSLDPAASRASAAISVAGGQIMASTPAAKPASPSRSRTRRASPSAAASPFIFQFPATSGRTCECHGHLPYLRCVDPSAREDGRGRLAASEPCRPDPGFIICRASASKCGKIANTVLARQRQSFARAGRLQPGTTHARCNATRRGELGGQGPARLLIIAFALLGRAPTSSATTAGARWRASAAPRSPPTSTGRPTRTRWRRSRAAWAAAASRQSRPRCWASSSAPCRA